MELKNLPGSQIYQVHMPAAAAADATAYLGLFRVPFKSRLKSLKYIPLTDVVGADTNSANLNVDNQDHATPNTEIANLDMTAAGGTITGGDGKAFTLSSTSADLDLAEGDVLRFEREKVGTGLATAAGCIVIELQGR